MKLIIFYFDYKANKIFKDETDRNGKTVKRLSTVNNFVCRNDVLAKIIEVEDTSEIKSQIDTDQKCFHVVKYLTVKSGESVFFDQADQVFRATDYGFARYDHVNHKIIVSQPLQIPKDKTKAVLLIHPSNSGKIPSFEEISEILIKRNIHSMVSKEEIDDALSKIDPEKPELHRVLVAKGKEPVNGYKEYFLPLIDMEKKAGKILEDGSIDYKEIDSIIHIKERQAVLKRIPGVDSEDGFTIYGDNIMASTEPRKGYMKGKNIVPSSDESIYVSAIDGCITLNRNYVSVLPIAVVNGDVDYQTGNIDFNGTVEISGSILPGFSVKAKDNIIVKNNVDDAFLEAGGDITVFSGIGGKGNTKILAEGNVKAKYIVNSMIEAKGEVTAKVYIINSQIYSNEKISVTDKNGKIIGGECMALKKVVTNISGGPKGNRTVLTAGKSIMIERELIKLRTDIGGMETEVDELKEYVKSIYGNEVFLNTKDFLTMLPEVKRKNCVLLLTKLAKINDSLKVTTEEYNKIMEKYKPESDPEVVVFEEVFPGTIINIKKRSKTIDKKYTNVKFYEDNEEKVVKFTFAV